jgi:uncharacterized protein (DUF1778 family)
MPAKDQNLNMRISESDKQVLTRAASMRGENLTSFVLQSAINEAQETLKHEKRIELTKQDIKKLLEVLNSTDQNENLHDAFAYYNKIIH